MTTGSATFGHDISVPGFVTVTDVSPPHAAEPEYVISNEATGRHFLANRATVQFFDALRQSGSVERALASAGISTDRGKLLLQNLLDHGVLTRPGETLAKAPAARSPVEGKMISVRWDLVDASALARRFAGLGRFFFSPVGYFFWLIAMGAMLFSLLVNREKAVLTLTQIFDASLGQWLLFAGLFVALKAVHEMGHALAYQDMCRQEGLSPGPIRMGLCIFALSPFPFTDVTGAWRLKSRFRRVMIGAGGIYFETWIMAALTLFWAQTQTGLLQTVILQVAIVAGALALLFNLNPAVKLDGYFMLTDFLRRPNLAGRASVAARRVFARALGAKSDPANKADLLYWVISYAYRWTIFAGIFWLTYQFDPRLAPLVLAVVVMLLIIRPLLASVSFARRIGVRPLRTVLTLAALSALVVGALVPLPYWQTVPAQLIRYDTRFVEPTEIGRVAVSEAGIVSMQTPDLDQQVRDVELRRAMLENLRLARFASAQEQTRLAGEIASFADTQATLAARRTATDWTPPDNAVWTPLDGQRLNGAWVTPGRTVRLAALSTSVPAYLRLRLDQAVLDRAVQIANGTPIRLRPTYDPDCTFFARLQVPRTSLVAVNGLVLLRAEPDAIDTSCAAQTPHGAAIVARLDAPSRSLFERARLSVARMLQNRLPINVNE